MPGSLFHLCLCSVPSHSFICPSISRLAGIRYKGLPIGNNGKCQGHWSLLCCEWERTEQAKQFYVLMKPYGFNTKENSGFSRVKILVDLSFFCLYSVHKSERVRMSFSYHESQEINIYAIVYLWSVITFWKSAFMTYLLHKALWVLLFPPTLRAHIEDLDELFQ